MFLFLKGSDLSDSEIGIIIACTAGTVILFLVFVLFLLCYRRYKYEHIHKMNARPPSPHITQKTTMNSLAQITPRSLEEELEANRNTCPMSQTGGHHEHHHDVEAVPKPQAPHSSQIAQLITHTYTNQEVLQFNEITLLPSSSTHSGSIYICG